MKAILSSITSIFVFYNRDGVKLLKNVPYEMEITGMSKYIYCNSKQLKWRVPIITTLALSLLDSILDAIYFLKISTGQINPLIVVPTWVYQLMLSYLFIGIASI